MLFFSSEGGTHTDCVCEEIAEEDNETEVVIQQKKTEQNYITRFPIIY
jgi:hypothetical protein